MKLAFYHSGDNPVDDLIRWRTNSPKMGGATHVALWFEAHHIQFASALATCGTAFTPDTEILNDPAHWQTIDIGDTVDESLVLKWCRENDHHAYGFIGDLCFFADIKDFCAREPFCSQVIMSCFQEQGVWKFADPTQISPRMIQLMALAVQELQAPPSDCKGGFRQ